MGERQLDRHEGKEELLRMRKGKGTGQGEKVGRSEGIRAGGEYGQSPAKAHMEMPSCNSLFCRILVCW